MTNSKMLVTQLSYRYTDPCYALVHLYKVILCFLCNLKIPRIGKVKSVTFTSISCLNV